MEWDGIARSKTGEKMTNEETNTLGSEEKKIEIDTKHSDDTTIIFR